MEKSTRYLALHPVSFASLILVEEEMRRDGRKNELKKNKLPSIGALTKDRKATQNYASDLLTDRYEYVLMQFNL